MPATTLAISSVDPGAAATTSGWHRDYKYVIRLPDAEVPAKAWLFCPTHAKGPIVILDLSVEDCTPSNLSAALTTRVVAAINTRQDALDEQRATLLAREHAALADFSAADKLWSAELERQFGRRAGDVRYTPRSHEGSLAPLHQAFATTRDAWFAAVENRRAAGLS